MIEINNLTKFSIQKKFFAGVAKKVLRGENKERENVSIAFVVPEEMRKINHRYRKKDLPTDVLSFGKVSSLKDEYAEVIICPEVVREQAKTSSLPFRKELAKMLIHGMLHALGYDHEQSEREALRMEEKQQHYLSKV